MRILFPVESCRLPVPRRNRTARGFSLLEVLVVVSLLSLIVLALMAVFSSTQRAFRSSVTQADVLEGSRAAVDLIASDLRNLTPSGSAAGNPVNFFVLANSTAYSPLVQSLPGSTITRTNLLNYFFALGRQNTKWTAVAYVVDTSTNSPLFALYRFYAETNTANSPQTLYNLFTTQIRQPQWTTTMSHIIDGVVHLTLRAYDPNGNWINPTYTNAANTAFVTSAISPYGDGYGEAQFYMFSNTVPAAVELELGVLEDQTLARAESRGVAGKAPNDPLAAAQWQYLQSQAGTVHVFRQRVTIPNVDRTAYQ